MSEKNKKIIDPFGNCFEITFCVLKSNADKLNTCLENLEKLSEKSEPIPFDLYEELFGYFFNKVEEENKIMGANVVVVSEKIISYFSKDKQYQFKQIQEQKEGLKFSFEECIRTILNGYKLNIWSVNSGNNRIAINLRVRDKIVNYFYDALCRYSEPFDNEIELFISFYKKVVIAAYITQELGFQFTSKKRFTKKELFDAAKKSISKGK